MKTQSSALRDLSIIVLLTIAFSALSLSIDFVTRLYAFFVTSLNLATLKLLINVGFFLLCGLLWLTYGRWQRASKQQRELEGIVSGINPGVLMVVDADKNIVMCNASVKTMFGYESDEVVGQKTELLYYDRRTNPKKRHEIFEALKRQGFHIGFAVGKKKSGETIPLEIITGNLKDRHGAVLLVNDITERRRAQDQLSWQRAVSNAVNQILESALSCGPEEELAKTCLAMARELTQSRSGLIVELDHVTDVLPPKTLETRERKISIVEHDQDRALLHRLHTGGHLVRLAQERTAIMVNDSSLGTRQEHSDGVARSAGAFLALSLWHQGGTIGVFAVASKDGEYGRADQEALENLAGAFVQALDRKRTEAALRESERRYRSLIEASPDAIILTDLYGNTITTSSQAALMFGLPSSEKAVQRNVYDFVAEEDQTRVYDHVLQTLEQGKVTDVEYRLARKDGTPFWGEASIAVITNSREEPWAFTAVIKDITYRKQTEEHLRKSEHRRAEAQRIAHLGNWDWELETKELFWSGEVYRIFGLLPGQFETTQEAFWSSVHPEDREHVTESVCQALTREAPYSFDHRILLPDGSERVVREEAEVTFDKAGAPIRIAGTVQDVTAHKQAEERILWQNALLTGVKHVLEETLVCSSEEEVARKCLSVAEGLTGSKFGFIGVVNVKGLVDSLALSDPGWDACRIPQSNSVAMIRDMEIRGIWGRIIKDGKSMISNDPASHADSVGTPEGHPPITSFLGVPLKHQGQTVGVIGLANKEKGYSSNDLEAVETLSVSFVEALMRKRGEKEREKIQAQLRQSQKMEALGTLAGGIAHDFNNLLAVIFGNAELAHQEAPEEGTLRDNIQEILLAGNRAKNLIRQILTFSRQDTPERRPVRIDRIIDETVEFVKASFPSSIEIHLETRVERPVVLADPTQIHQIVLNLCANARDAMEGEKGLLRISLAEENLDAQPCGRHPDLQPGCYLRLTVSDTGCGMDPSVRERIFDPFFTTKASGKGTGMGLAMIHGILEALQGAIKVETEPGKGTTFEVYLPKQESAWVEQQDEKLCSEYPPGKGRILFVDDEPALVRMCKRMIADLGYEVMAMTSSVDALKAFRARPLAFDLIITDMTMPNLTGVELAREMFKIRADIPVLICTGFSESLTPEKARELGLRGLLMKPVASRELAEAIRRAMQKPGNSSLPRQRSTVLVVDDEEPVHRMLQQILEGEGYRVLLASDGKQGLSVLAEEIIVLVITDIFMPGMDGLEVIRKVREEFPRVKLIAVSGGSRAFSGGDFLRIADTLGADRILYKPFDREELLHAVRDLIGDAENESPEPIEAAA